jgi:exopolysaccharide biosynthesis polyprenyl glycosylphosphotransferase
MSKRFLDLFGAIMGIIVLLPVYILISILIKLSDPGGAILYKQERVGVNGRKFQMYKFRSMVSNADLIFDQIKRDNEIAGKMFKMKEDPRITPIGRFLRRTSLDELPQLWNVIRGEMSLVGPRPPLPREVSEYNEHELLRLSVIPGCTGLWQVSGRNKLDFHKMVELDLYYIDHQSLWLDLKILCKTIPVVFTKDGAY